MRLRLLLLGALVAAAAAAAAQPALAAGTDPQAAGLQVALRAQGLYRGPIDAIAGAETVAAVRAFQRSHGLRPTGLAGARTRRDLGPLGRPLFGSRPLRRGSFGWDVAVLQFLLVRAGIAVPVNAYFDGPTLRGVRQLQRRLHLPVDGIVGPRTRAALLRQRLPLTRVAARPRLRVHVVRRGESLWVLAKRYGTTIARLARLNHLDPARPLLAGRRLRVPVGRSTVARLQPVAYRTGSVGSVRALLDLWAARYGVQPRLVRALAWMESGYNNALVSPAGARGIMQVMPTTWQYVEAVLLGRRVRHDAAGNIRVGVAYLQHLLRDFHGNRRLALAAWYQGERSVRQDGVLAVSRRFVADVLALELRV